MIFDEKYETNAYDYSETFHKTIWGAIVNIAKKGNIQKISPVEIENEIAQFPSATTVWKNNDGWNYIDKAIAESADKLLNAGFYRDTVRKYSIIRNAVESLKLDISFLYDEEELQYGYIEVLERMIGSYQLTKRQKEAMNYAVNSAILKIFGKVLLEIIILFTQAMILKIEYLNIKIRQIHMVIPFKVVISPQYIVE